MNTNRAVQPFLKWAGGKGQLLEQYFPFLPTTIGTYYEPFLGGGALFFHLQPQRAVLSDINPELVNAYCCIRDRVEEVIALLDEHQKRHCRDYYYQVRSIVGKDAISQAARLIYLNKTCYNGLYQENQKGMFNVPVGRYKNPTICNPERLRSVSHVLQSVTISCSSFEAILTSTLTGEDFVYFDPPYHPISSTSRFTSYSRYSFSAQDQIHLRDVFTKLACQGVQVTLSNSDTSFVRELYQEFPIHTITAARAINSRATKRGPISELLITSY
ncbi:MAG: DNA adenine methylase [Elainellaceae cyanobacterium]